jgi:MFS family permease
MALSIIVFLSSGIRFTIGPFLTPVSADLGVDRGTFSLVIALSLLLYGAFMPLVGRLVERMGSRVVCTAGAVVMAASLVLTDHGVHPMAAASAIGVAGALLLTAAILSLSIDEKARPACRTVPIPSRPHPVAGGR